MSIKIANVSQRVDCGWPQAGSPAINLRRTEALKFSEMPISWQERIVIQILLSIPTDTVSMFPKLCVSKTLTKQPIGPKYVSPPPHTHFLLALHYNQSSFVFLFLLSHFLCQLPTAVDPMCTTMQHDTLSSLFMTADWKFRAKENFSVQSRTRAEGKLLLMQ